MKISILSLHEKNNTRKKFCKFTTLKVFFPPLPLPSHDRKLLSQKKILTLHYLFIYNNNTNNNNKL